MRPAHLSMVPIRRYRIALMIRWIILFPSMQPRRNQTSWRLTLMRSCTTFRLQDSGSSQCMVRPVARIWRISALRTSWGQEKRSRYLTMATVREILHISTISWPAWKRWWPRLLTKQSVRTGFLFHLTLSITLEITILRTCWISCRYWARNW